MQPASAGGRAGRGSKASAAGAKQWQRRRRQRTSRYTAAAALDEEAHQHGGTPPLGLGMDGGRSTDGARGIRKYPIRLCGSLLMVVT